MRAVIGGALRGLLKFLKREPALAAAVTLGALNAVSDLTSEQQLAFATLVESLVVLLAGWVVRQNVTPYPGDPERPTPKPPGDAPPAPRPPPPAPTPKPPPQPPDSGGLPPSRRG